MHTLFHPCYKNKIHSLSPCSFNFSMENANCFSFKSPQDLLSELEGRPLHFLTNPCHREHGVLSLDRFLNLLCKSIQKNSAFRSLTEKDLMMGKGMMDWCGVWNRSLVIFTLPLYLKHWFYICRCIFCSFIHSFIHSQWITCLFSAKYQALRRHIGLIIILKKKSKQLSDWWVSLWMLSRSHSAELV